MKTPIHYTSERRVDCRYRLELVSTLTEMVGRSSWRSNGSSVLLRSIRVSTLQLVDAEEIRLNGRIRWTSWTWRPWIEWFKSPMLELYRVRWRHIRFRRFLTLNWIYFLCGGDSAFADDLDRYLELSIKSRKQTTVTTSTTEAELLAPSRAAQETYWWWKRLFNAVDFELDNDIHISCDSRFYKEGRYRIKKQRWNMSTSTITSLGTSKSRSTERSNRYQIRRWTDKASNCPKFYCSAPSETSRFQRYTQSQLKT